MQTKLNTIKRLWLEIYTVADSMSDLKKLQAFCFCHSLASIDLGKGL
jgi:hypothetical protein